MADDRRGRKIDMRLEPEDQERFDRVRRYMSPNSPERLPITEVMRYCLEITDEYVAKAASKHS